MSRSQKVQQGDSDTILLLKQIERGEPTSGCRKCFKGPNKARAITFLQQLVGSQAPLPLVPEAELPGRLGRSLQQRSLMELPERVECLRFAQLVQAAGRGRLDRSEDPHEQLQHTEILPSAS